MKTPSVSRENLSFRIIALEIAVVSFVILFQELTLIRWLPSKIRVLAYFPNLILISAFLGLGLGSLRAGKRTLLWLWPFSLILICVFAVGLSRVVFTQRSTTEHLWLLYYDLPQDATVVSDVRLPIILAFLLNTLSFLPLGQFIAVRLQKFRERSSALWGYSWNIFGSLLGVLGFVLAALLNAFPAVWFAIFLVPGTVAFAGKPRRLIFYGACVVLIVAMVAVHENNEFYSPYYAIKVDRHPDGSISVLTNGSLHQHGLDLSEEKGRNHEMISLVREGYRLPYRLLRSPPEYVLVLGAGTGNDVGILLDEGVKRIDAVEIDPVILEIGKDMQPGRPYSSPRVRIYNTDARSYLNRSREQYDIITFGTLDSMTRLSALSGVRLDSFVYTINCLRAARARLPSGRGGIVIYFMVETDYIHYRMVGMLSEIFGRKPYVVRKNFGLFNVIYLAGPAFEHLDSGIEIKDGVISPGRIKSGLELPSDDWPYLYLRNRGISGFYLSLLAVFAVVAVVGVLLASREMRASLLSIEKFDSEMLLFGLAFLLLETRSITEMNLVWGATWFTSAVVFGSILLVILLATILIRLKPIPLSISAPALLVTLLLSYMFPVNRLLGYGFWFRLASSTIIIGSPIFFAAVCFAHRFKERKDVRIAFGWNLLGSVVGGLLEFFAMITGFKGLLIIAFGAYTLAFIIFLRKRPGGEETIFK